MRFMMIAELSLLLSLVIAEQSINERTIACSLRFAVSGKNETEA